MKTTNKWSYRRTLKSRKLNFKEALKRNKDIKIKKVEKEEVRERLKKGCFWSFYYKIIGKKKKRIIKEETVRTSQIEDAPKFIEVDGITRSAEFYM